MELMVYYMHARQLSVSGSADNLDKGRRNRFGPASNIIASVRWNCKDRSLARIQRRERLDIYARKISR